MILSSKTTARTIGGAGTGKTTELMGIVEKLLDRLGDPTLIGFCSFTRAARREAVERAATRFSIAPETIEKHGWFRTLHAICYRVLSSRAGDLLTDNVASRKWLQSALDCPVTGTGEQLDDGGDVPSIAEGNTDEARALKLWAYARNRLEPVEAVWSHARRIDGHTPSLADVTRIIEQYERCKRLDNKCDFTDLLAMFAGWNMTIDGPQPTDPEGIPPDVHAWILDEAQDVSALSGSVFRRLIEHDTVQWVYLAGDPFQCQPAGTLVTTAAGKKPIEALDPQADNLICYNRKDGRWYGSEKRVAFEIASRCVDSSEVWSIRTEDGDELFATTNHKWLVRIDSPSTKYVSYLMVCGNRSRVGTCVMFTDNPNKNGTYRLGQRARLEKADRAWILKVFDTDREARAYEQFLSCRYGITQITFEPPACRTHTNLNREFIDSVFSMIGCTSAATLNCLADHDKQFQFPDWKRGEPIKRGRMVTTVTQTCNLIPGITKLPKVNDNAFIDGRATRKNGVHRQHLKLKKRVENSLKWSTVVEVNRLPRGNTIPVWSLDVDRHHTYIADGYVTHNSIYSFSGADHHVFIDWPVAKERIAPKSWRCPKPILELGERILRRCSDYFDRGIAPADHDGEVISFPLLQTILSEVSPDQSWLILTRAKYQQNVIGKLLDFHACPWIGTKGGGWDAPVRNQATNTLIAMERGQPIMVEEWPAVLKNIKLTRESGRQALLVRGTKKRFEHMKINDLRGMGHRTADQWGDLGVTPELSEIIRSGRWRNPESLLVPYAHRYYRAVERHGFTAPTETKVRVGTIHSAKGAEADNVIVLTTTTERCVREAESSVASADAEHRVFYVAATRARRRLFLCREDDVERGRKPEYAI